MASWRRVSKIETRTKRKKRKKEWLPDEEFERLKQERREKKEKEKTWLPDEEYEKLKQERREKREQQRYEKREKYDKSKDR